VLARTVSNEIAGNVTCSRSEDAGQFAGTRRFSSSVQFNTTLICAVD